MPLGPGRSVAFASCWLALSCAGHGVTPRAGVPERLAAPLQRPPPLPVALPAPSEPEPALPAPDPPMPRKPLWEGRSSVPYQLFVEEVRRVADELASAPEVERSYRALLADYDLLPSDLDIESYSRVRLVFEATRDGGLWGVRWAITDRMPWSDAIWEQWRAVDFDGVDPDVTAAAECDELSALFAFLARDLGIRGFVGLHWPTWNHTVAVWEIRRGATERDPGARVRVMVPTSQVWLTRAATLGSREFKTHRAVFPYARKDLAPEHALPVGLARFLVERLERYGALSNEALLERRNRLGGS